MCLSPYGIKRKKWDFNAIPVNQYFAMSNAAWIKFGFSEKATKFEKIFVVLLTRASCYVRATAYLSKSRRFLKTNADKSYYTNFNTLAHCARLWYWKKETLKLVFSHVYSGIHTHEAEEHFWWATTQACFFFFLDLSLRE